MDKKKVIYIGLLFIIAVLVIVTSFSYAFFAHRDEQHGKLNIVAGKLNYKLEAIGLNANNQITLAAGEVKKLEIKLTSLNSVNSKYELFYETTNNQIKVGYSGSVATTGTINAKDSKIIIISLKNSTNTSAIITFIVEGGLVTNPLVRSKGLAIPASSTLCNYTTNQVFNFSYTGDSQAIDTDFCDGNYKVELWGAQGANTTGSNVSALGGRGAYTSGILNITGIQQFYVYVGSEGSATPAGELLSIPTGFNGGGASGGQACCSGGGRSFGTGGGATDIRLVNGSWNDFDSLKSRIMVAAGGGGSYSGLYSGSAVYANDGGAGGGLTGYAGTQSGANIDQYYCYGKGALQIEGGRITADCRSASSNYHNLLTGSFGTGGGTNNGANTGGGGGYYGGSRSGHIASAGGGSSYISGHNGCNAIAEYSTSSDIIHTGQANHYSGLVFTNTNMIDGSGHTWTTTDTGAKSNNLMPKPSGGTYTINNGHTGNGYARITYLGN